MKLISAAIALAVLFLFGLQTVAQTGNPCQAHDTAQAVICVYTYTPTTNSATATPTRTIAASWTPTASPSATATASHTPRPTNTPPPLNPILITATALAGDVYETATYAATTGLSPEDIQATANVLARATHAQQTLEAYDTPQAPTPVDLRTVTPTQEASAQVDVIRFEVVSGIGLNVRNAPYGAIVNRLQFGGEVEVFAGTRVASNGGDSRNATCDWWQTTLGEWVAERCGATVYLVRQ